MEPFMELPRSRGDLFPAKEEVDGSFASVVTADHCSAEGHR
jgi:hypothetical protein